MIDSREQMLFDTLSLIINPERNSENYRRKVASYTQRECVPYLGIFLGDVFMLHEGIPTLI